MIETTTLGTITVKDIEKAIEDLKEWIIFCNPDDVDELKERLGNEYIYSAVPYVEKGKAMVCRKGDIKLW